MTVLRGIATTSSLGEKRAVTDPLPNAITRQETILIVDDIPTNLEVLFNFLSESGYRILVAEDGESAIAKAKYALPDLILLDILMPGLDGFTTCRRLKAEQQTAEIPVIFMTALTETVDKIKGFNLGAVDYITKPFQQEEVLARVKTQLSMQNLTRQLLDLYNNAPCGYHSIDAEGTFVRINDTALQWLGYDREEVIGKKKFSDLLPTESLARFQETFSRFLQDGQIHNVEFQLLRKDGTPLPVLLNATAILDPAGNFLMSRTTLLDISERVRLDAERQRIETEREHAIEVLRESEERFHQAFQNAAIGMALVSLQGQWLQVNRSLCAMLGYSEQELLTTTFQSLTHPDDLAMGVSALNRLLAGEINTCQMEKRYLHKRGHIVWVMISSSIIHNSQGQPLYTVVQIEDITDRKQAVEQLQTLSQALESAVEGISQLDAQGRYVQVNPAYASLLGYTTDELIGTQWQQTVYAEDLESMQAAYQQMLRDGKAEVETRGIRKDGTVFDKQVVMVKSFDQQQRFNGSYCFVKDISDRREMERLKDEFISIVSHELRTPLTSISGALDLLANGVLQSQPEDAQRMLNIAASSTDRLVRLINDILDIERIESGKVAMTMQVCDTAELVTEAVEAMQDMAERAGITFVVSPLAAPIWADPDRVIQVLTNLLSNAIKFSPAGSTVQLNVTRVNRQPPDADAQAATPHLLFSVQDQGRGIPYDKLETIFGRFQQVDASDSRQKGGTGLGLAICRTILQPHGGEIWAESTPGTGSTFYFTLPVCNAPPDTPTSPRPKPTDAIAQAPSPLQAPLVLMCDDDPAVRNVVQAMLERQGYQVIAVASGQEAIQRALRQPPDVLLLNLMMPEMDGWETLAHLRQHPEIQNVPVIILSGLLPDARQVSLPTVNDWLVKPPNQRLLFQALERALAKHREVINVLVIEDDVELAQVLLTVFTRHGIQAFHAATGREAVQLSQRVVPDLLVLDLGLPEQDGFAVVDWLRQHNRLCQVTLVVYTARDLTDDDRDRLKLGQTLFLTKGRVTPQEFERRVVDLLNRITQGKKGEEADGSQTSTHH